MTDAPRADRGLRCAVLLRRGAAVVIGALVGLSCATPRQPPGGPPDQTPPSLEASTPAAGTVGVDLATDALRLTFSEFVEQASLGRALAITPEPEGRIEIRWRGRTATIRLPEPLRENTTYVITIDTNLRDTRGVALRQPLTLAFSTGPQIDQGRLAGRVVAAERGTPMAGLDVYAYALPDSSAPAALPERPAYRTQTDTEGRFVLDYLSARPYFVLALADGNRNRHPDPGETIAVPPRPALVPAADTTAGPADLRWIAARRDAVPPEVVRLRPLSSRRLELRFSEPVRLATPRPAGWSLIDSTSARAVPVRAVYALAEDPRRLYVLADSMAGGPHRLELPPAAVADTVGTPARADTLRFAASALPDTLRLRFAGFRPAADTTGPTVLPPGVWPALRFNQPVDSLQLRALVTMSDSAGAALGFSAATDDGVTYRLVPDPMPPPGARFRVRLDARALADTIRTQPFRRIATRDLGDLSGYVADTSAAAVVELYRDAAAAPVATTRPDATGYFVFRNLTEGRYRFRVFLDRDADGAWDSGRITPYRPAEPIAWSTEAPAWRARWETSLADTLRLEPRR